MKKKWTSWVLILCLVVSSVSTVYAADDALGAENGETADEEVVASEETVKDTEAVAAEAETEAVAAEAEMEAITAEAEAETIAVEAETETEAADTETDTETADTVEDAALDTDVNEAADETGKSAPVETTAEPENVPQEIAEEDQNVSETKEITAAEETSENKAAMAEIVQQGDYYHVIWELYDDGVLYIDKAENQSDGYMAGYLPSEGDLPWYAYRDQIKAIILSEDVQSIASNAFVNCKNLTSVTFRGNRIYSIGWNAFSGCSSLPEITLPSNIGTIEASAFANCTSLKTINLYNTRVTSIGTYAFSYCKSLEAVDLPYPFYDIGEAAFKGCSAMQTFTMPHTVNTIGNSAFSGCSSLTEIIISDNVKKIGSDTFYNCSKLERVVLPDGLTEIGKNAFSSCSSLTDCLIPDSVTTIGQSAFSGCRGLAEIVIPAGVKTLPTYSFSNTGATKVILPEGLETIGSGALGFNNAEEIVIPQSVSTIGNGAFNYCYELKKINIPSLVKTIDYNTFSCCYKLEEVILTDGLETIGNNAFYNCTALKELVIPGSVTSISQTAFTNCSALTDIRFEGSREAWNALGLQLDGVTVHCGNFSVPVTIILSDESLMYDGTPKTNGVTVTSGDKVLIQDEDYTVSYSNNINAGNAYVIITGIGEYSGQAEKIFRIEPVPIDEVFIMPPGAQTYTGSALRPKLSVSYDGKALVENTDYTLAYADNKEVGMASITIQGKGNFNSSFTQYFEIKKAAQKPTIKAAATKVPVGKTTTISVTGMKETPAITYTTSDKTIATVDKNGTVKGIKAGSATITVTWKTTKHYTGSSKKITINVVPIATKTFTATNVSTGVQLKWTKVTGGASGYRIYRDGTFVHTVPSAATLTWTDTDAVNGKTYTYKIYAYVTINKTKVNSTLSKSVKKCYLKKPAAPTLKNSKSKQMTISWTKNVQADGYQIQYSKTSTFLSGKTTTKKLKGAGTLKATYTMASTGTWYVRIRSYREISGTPYYSAWSAKKSIKIK